MTDTMGAVRTELCEDGRVWDTYVRSSGKATLFHLWAWSDIIAGAYRQSPRYVVAMRNEAVTGVLPLIRVRSPLFGTLTASLPYHCLGGPLADDGASLEALLDRARLEADKASGGKLQIRSFQKLDGPWRIDEEKVTFTRDLSGGPDAVFKSLRKQNRNRIRRGERDGFEIVLGHNLVDEFYALYVRTMRVLGSPVGTPRFFRDILSGFGQDANVAVAYSGGRPVAAKIFIDAFGTRYFLCGATDERYREGAPSYLLMWRCMIDAAELGIVSCDLGRSTRGSTHADTKRYWGCEEVPLYYHHAPADRGTSSQASVSNPRFDAAIRVWRRLPLWLTRVVGPRIARLIP